MVAACCLRCKMQFTKWLRRPFAAGFETNYSSPYLHHVKVENLSPNTKYLYALLLPACLPETVLSLTAGVC